MKPRCRRRSRFSLEAGACAAPRLSATNGVPLRPNRVHPLWRTDHDNNVGIGAPEIEYGYRAGRRMD